MRIAWGAVDHGINFNLDHTKTNGRGAMPDPNGWKVGAEYVRYLWAGTLGNKGARVSIAGSWETFDDVRSAKHDDVATVGLKVDLPTPGSTSVKLPISIIWANHEDLLTEADSVRAHIGFTVDFGEALKKQKTGN